MSTLECRKALNKYCHWNTSTPKPFLHCHVFCLSLKCSRLYSGWPANKIKWHTHNFVKSERCQLIVNQHSWECITWLTLYSRRILLHICFFWVCFLLLVSSQVLYSFLWRFLLLFHRVTKCQFAICCTDLSAKVNEYTFWSIFFLK